MTEGAPINASQLFSDDASEFFIDAGVPRYNRRLTDKILAAFNHAYAMGEMDLARNLWECLVAAEKLGQQYHHRRRPNQSLDLAAEWVAFVDARDRYREVSRTPQAAGENASDAFRAMRDAYQSWRAHNSSESASPLRPTAAAGSAGAEAGRPPETRPHEPPFSGGHD
ncbi:MAG TPA: hypothetical protein VIF14_00705 [Alphaproteobacteria bacterium]|jgi:hypothetical protein